MSQALAGFAVVAEIAMPAIRVDIRPGPAPLLQVLLEEGGMLLVAPSCLLWRHGGIQLQDCPVPGLALAYDAGQLALSPATASSIILLSVPAARAVDCVPGSLLALAVGLQTGVVLGGHGQTLLRLTALQDEAGWVALRAAGTFRYHVLAPGQALDLAPGALLVKDAPVDLSRGEHLWTPPVITSSPPPWTARFVQCVGVGGIGLQSMGWRENDGSDARTGAP